MDTEALVTTALVCLGALALSAAGVQTAMRGIRRRNRARRRIGRAGGPAAGARVNPSEATNG